MTGSAIRWNINKTDAEAVAAIVERASAIRGIDRMRTTMDITAAHLNGCPLDLKGLSEASDFDFAHDVAGIILHIDRSTGRIGGGFLPRYWKGNG